LGEITQSLDTAWWPRLCTLRSLHAHICFRGSHGSVDKLKPWCSAAKIELLLFSQAPVWGKPPTGSHCLAWHAMCRMATHCVPMCTASHGTQCVGSPLRVEFSKDMQDMKEMMAIPRMRGVYHVLCAKFSWKVSRPLPSIVLTRL